MPRTEQSPLLSLLQCSRGVTRPQMGGGSTEHVYAADRGYVVVLVLGDLVTRRHFVRGLEGAAQLFIILMIRSPVQDVCTLVRLKTLNFV